MSFRKKFIIIFLLTFLIGCSSVFFWFKSVSDSKEEKEKNLQIVIAEIQKTTESSKPTPQPFTPEIFGLKDFSDSKDFHESFKLVDVINHGSNYRSEEVIAKNGQVWLGLFKDQENFYLKNTKVKIIPDGETGYDDQKFVSIKLKNKSVPLFLVKNARKLKERDVKTLFNAKSFEDEETEDNTNTMYRGFLREFQIGERKYTLRIKDALTESGDKVLALVLESENISQVVTYGPYFDNDFLGDLLWVGDLDGDDKLDFYMNFNDWEKGSFSSSLFLSSEAGKGNLVKEVAGFWSAGC